MNIPVFRPSNILITSGLSGAASADTEAEYILLYWLYNIIPKRVNKKSEFNIHIVCRMATTDP
jgi:hypothetical protein